MNKSRILSLVIGGLVAVSWLSGTALAHETRPVLGGKYTLRVGFIVEPTYQGLENGLELTVCNGVNCTTSKDGSGTLTNGIEGALDTLKAEVIFGSQSMSLTLAPVPRQPGRFNARFVPTRVGDYAFHIYGKINSDPVDERFTSGPNTFDSVQPLTNEQFPDKPGFAVGSGSAAANPVATPPAVTPLSVFVPTVASTPAASSTSTTLAPSFSQAPSGPSASTVSSSTPSALDPTQVLDLRTQLTAQKQQLDEAKSSASTASTFAYIGVGVGLAGLLVALVGLFARRPNRKPKPERERG